MLLDLLEAVAVAVVIALAALAWEALRWVASKLQNGVMKND